MDCCCANVYQARLACLVDCCFPLFLNFKFAELSLLLQNFCNFISWTKNNTVSFFTQKWCWPLVIFDVPNLTLPNLSNTPQNIWGSVGNSNSFWKNLFFYSNLFTNLLTIKNYINFIIFRELSGQYDMFW